MKIKIFISLITFQLVIILFLGFKIYQRQKNILGTISVNPINKESIALKPSNELKYFYEPGQNFTDKTPGHSYFKAFKAIYTINEDGLNERFNYSLEKPNNVFRIITIGDSFTFGLYVDTKDNWTEVLEDILNKELSCQNIKKFEVINLGVEGYDFEYAVERFKVRGLKYNPDLVLWLMIDPNRLNELRIPIFNKLIKERGHDYESNLEKKGIFGQTFIESENEVIKQIGKDKVFEYQKKAIEKLNDYYSSSLVLIIPPWFDQNTNDMLTDFSKSRGKTHLFFENNKPFYSDNQLPDGHPNQKGHQIIAQDVLDYIKKYKFIPCY